MRKEEDDGWEDDPTQEKLYKVLRGAFERADAAAKAVARLEHDIAEEHRVFSEDEIEDKVDDEEGAVTVRSAQESNRDFDDTNFNELFDKMNVIRLTSDLAEILKIDGQTKKEIISTLIAGEFGSSPPRSPREAIGKKTVVGDDLGVFLHNVKAKAAREQKSKRRNGG